jgi:hypothetical protein
LLLVVVKGLTGVIHPVYGGCMTPTRYEPFDTKGTATIDDHEERCRRLIARQLPRIFPPHRRVVGS